MNEPRPRLAPVQNPANLIPASFIWLPRRALDAEKPAPLDSWPPAIAAPIVNHIRQPAATEPGAAKRRGISSFYANRNSASIVVEQALSAALDGAARFGTRQRKYLEIGHQTHTGRCGPGAGSGAVHRHGRRSAAATGSPEQWFRTARPAAPAAGAKASRQSSRTRGRCDPWRLEN